MSVDRDVGGMFSVFEVKYISLLVKAQLQNWKINNKSEKTERKTIILNELWNLSN